MRPNESNQPASEVWGANLQSGRRYWRLKQTAAMLAPRVLIDSGGGAARCSGALRGRRAIERAMDAIGVVIIPEISQLSRAVGNVPKKHMIQILAPYRADQAFDERMRNRYVRNRLDLVDFEDAQSGEPAVKAKQLSSQPILSSAA